MIEFVTAYDEATKANLSVASGLLSKSAFVNEAATRANLQAALQERPFESLVVWSHGNHDGPKAQDGLPALPAEVLSSVKPRRAWAWACHTGTRFGERVSRLGWTWWGFTGAITAPDTDEPKMVKLLAGAFEAALVAFQSGQTPSSVTTALVGLRLKLETIQEELDALEANLVCYKFLLELWDRARVWFPEHDSPTTHPEATRPLLLE
ncbi:MAG TPA: hypothetical protein VEU33_42155 [Archangium sp.]|nr:hypothetical protein [Archangium sp.]